MRRAAVFFALVLLTATAFAEQALTRQDADRFQAKLVRIVQYGNGAAPKTAVAAARTTQVSDLEINAYLRYHAASEIPVGIVDPMLYALGSGRVSGRAIVDLDAVRKSKPRGWLDPLGYMTGKMPLTAAGRLTTEKGVGRFTLESAELSGVSVPKTVIQELLTFYSRTPEDPDGINMDDPFELPSRIREIRVATGSATIVQ